MKVKRCDYEWLIIVLAILSKTQKNSFGSVSVEILQNRHCHVVLVTGTRLMQACNYRLLECKTFDMCNFLRLHDIFHVIYCASSLSQKWRQSCFCLKWLLGAIFPMVSFSECDFLIKSFMSFPFFMSSFPYWSSCWFNRLEYWNKLAATHISPLT